MTFNRLNLKYVLEDRSNFIDWKDHMEEVFNDNGLLEYIKRDVTKSSKYDAQNLAQWKKVIAKVWIIILEGAQDHVVNNLHGKENRYVMW